MQKFDIQIVGQRDIQAMIGEFLVHPPLRERPFVVVCWGVCCVVRHLGGEKQ